MNSNRNCSYSLTVLTPCLISRLEDLQSTLASLRLYFNEQYSAIVICLDKHSQLAHDHIMYFANTLNTPYLIHYQTKPGLHTAFNELVDLVKTSHYMILNAGDLIHPDALSYSVCDHLKLSNPMEILYSNIATSSNSPLLRRALVSYPKILQLNDFLQLSNPINHQATIYPSSTKKYKYPPSIPGLDYQHNLNLFLSGYRFTNINLLLCIYDIKGISSARPFIRLFNNLSFNLSIKRRLSSYYLFRLVIFFPFVFLTHLLKHLFVSLR